MRPITNGLYPPFGAVIADFEASVQQAIRQRCPLVRQIDERLTEFGLRRNRPGVAPCPESVQKRLFPLQTLLIPLLRRQSLQFPLYQEQFCAVRLSGDGGSGFGAFEQGFDRLVKLPAQMRPTAQMYDALHAVVAVIAVRLEAAVKTGQELRRITAAAPRLIFVERDLPLFRRPVMYSRI